MHFNFQKHQSKQIIQDYVSWRLTQAGFSQWNLINKIDFNKNSKTKLCLIMRQMAFEFENKFEKYYASFNFQFEATDTNCKDMFNTILIDLFELSDTNDYSDNKESDNENKLSENCINLNFNLSSKENQNLKCNWSKLVSLFSFTGALAVQLYEIPAPNLIYCLIDLLTDFINNDKRIFAWISSQGSWNGFIDYYEERKQFLNLTQNEFKSTNQLHNDSTEESFKSYFLNFTNNSCISRPVSPTSNIISISDTITSKNDQERSLAAVHTQLKNTFFKLSQYAAVGVGSIGVLVLGAVYMKKRI